MRMTGKGKDQREGHGSHTILHTEIVGCSLLFSLAAKAGRTHDSFPKTDREAGVRKKRRRSARSGHCLFASGAR